MNLISRVTSYLLGSLRLKVSGEYCERFLNILAANSISFWNPYVKKNDFYITVLRKDIMKIRVLRRNTGVKIKINEKRGFPLIFNRYKRRYGLMFGFVIFIVILNLLGASMWNVKVSGSVNITEEQIIDFLNKNNVRYGDSVKKIDTDILRQKLILSFDSVAWASINKQGSVLEVNITEFESNDEISSPYNIVAECDGIIKRLDISKGNVNVKVGDTVTKDQILVSGVINSNYGNFFIEPNGEVIAEIKKKEIIEVKKIQKEVFYSGEFKNQYAVEIMGVAIPLSIKSEKGLFESQNSVKKMKIFGGEIPIKIYNDKLFYTNEISYKIGIEEAEDIAKREINKIFEDANAQNTEIKLVGYKDKNDQYVFEFSTTCLKDIGKKKLIEFY